MSSISAVARARVLSSQPLSSIPSWLQSSAGTSHSFSTSSSTNSNVKKSFLARHPKKIASALAVSACGGYYFSTKSSSSSSSNPSTSTGTGTIPAIPPFDVRNFANFRDIQDFKKNQDIVLYQYETCPFCNKVRAFLDYSGIKYRVVEVNPLTKEEKKVTPQLAAIKEVPVVTINGHILTDSTPIIKNINEILNLYRSKQDQHIVTPDEEASLKFVDSRVVILTAPNIYRTFRESIDSFDYIGKNSQLSANSSAFKQALTKYVGAVMMYLITEKKLKKKYNITDARESLYTAIREWIAGNNGKPFRGGTKPNLADVTCFGVFRALSHYQAGEDCMNVSNTSAEFVAWYRNMEKLIDAAK